MNNDQFKIQRGHEKTRKIALIYQHQQPELSAL
jgi:hypothetical protein